MSLQHRKFVDRLRNAERLRLYVQSRLFAWESLDASLKEAQLTARRWEMEAKESADKAARAEVERYAAHHETVIVRLETEAAGSTRAQVELELTRIQNILTALEDGWLKAESKLNSVQQALVATNEAC